MSNSSRVKFNSDLEMIKTVCEIILNEKLPEMLLIQLEIDSVFDEGKSFPI